MEPKFKVGDVVLVVRPGQTYSSHSRMFRKLGFKDLHRNPSFKENTVAQVFAVHQEGNDSAMEIFVGVVDACGNESLLSQEGLRLVDFTEKRNERRVEISSEYTAVISKDGIKVGCQNISAEKLQEIIEAAHAVGLYG